MTTVNEARPSLHWNTDNSRCLATRAAEGRNRGPEKPLSPCPGELCNATGTGRERNSSCEGVRPRARLRLIPRGKSDGWAPLRVRYPCSDAAPCVDCPGPNLRPLQGSCCEFGYQRCCGGSEMRRPKCDRSAFYGLCSRLPFPESPGPHAPALVVLEPGMCDKTVPKNALREGSEWHRRRFLFGRTKNLSEPNANWDKTICVLKSGGETARKKRRGNGRFSPPQRGLSRLGFGGYIERQFLKEREGREGELVTNRGDKSAGRKQAPEEPLGKLRNNQKRKMRKGGDENEKETMRAIQLAPPLNGRFWTFRDKFHSSHRQIATCATEWHTQQQMVTVTAQSHRCFAAFLRFAFGMAILP
ncbi:hypothetical protein niasHT_000737 [Heterodera trifolii]|uniref:Uncharacterized protein n=1 Tax=Heterodera trifolii TaxID=157864 RepID=A0ABD2LNG0_9BILA